METTSLIVTTTIKVWIHSKHDIRKNNFKMRKRKKEREREREWERIREWKKLIWMRFTKKCFDIGITVIRVSFGVMVSHLHFPNWIIILRKMPKAVLSSTTSSNNKDFVWLWKENRKLWLLTFFSTSLEATSQIQILKFNRKFHE